MKRLGILFGTILLAGACAHTEAGLTTSPTVSDEKLARVPADQLGGVNEARAMQTEAKDEVARKALEVKKAKKEVDLANQDLKVAQAQIDRARKGNENSRFNRDAAGEKTTTSQLASAQAQLVAAKSRIELAKAQLTLAEDQHRRAETEMSLGTAKVDLAKAEALTASGDPSATSINTAAIQQRINSAQENLARMDVQLQQDEAAVASARERSASDADLAGKMPGVGGSGNEGQSPIPPSTASSPSKDPVELEQAEPLPQSAP
ncbi:MAG: hypothetical protein ACT4TC_08865 [Myxococcaceae bacterium]